MEMRCILWFLYLCLGLVASAQLDLRSAAYPPILGQPSSIFNPTNISGMILWTSATNYSTNANGTVISSWTDMSGNNNHFTNPATGRQPYVTNNYLNGQTAIRFPGTAIDFRWLEASNAFMGSLTQAEMFVVLKSEVAIAAATVDVAWDFGGPQLASATGHPSTAAVLFDTFGLGVVNFGNINVTNYYSNVNVITNPHIYNISIRTNELIIRYNGNIENGLDNIPAGKVAFSNRVFMAKFRDSAHSWDGGFGEWMIWNRVLETNERASVYTYLSNKFSIPYTNQDLAIAPDTYPNLLAWWKASDIVTNDGALQTNWLSAVNGWQWTNRAANLTVPRYVANAINGHPGIRFLNGLSGSNQTMVLMNTGVTNGQIVLPADYTIMIVGSYTNIAAPLNGDTAGATAIIMQQNGLNRNEDYQNGVVADFDMSRATNQFRLDVFTRRSNLHFSWQNATNGNPAGISKSMGTRKFQNLMPTGLSTDATICEIVFFTNTIPNEDVIRMYYKYFRPKFGLP